MSTYIRSESKTESEYEQPSKNNSDDEFNSESYKNNTDDEFNSESYKKKTTSQKPTSDYLLIDEQDLGAEPSPTKESPYSEMQTRSTTTEEISKAVRESEALEQQVRNVSEQALNNEFEQRMEEILRTSNNTRQVVAEISDEQSRQVVIDLLDMSDEVDTNEVRLASKTELTQMTDALHGEIEGLHKTVIRLLVWPASLVFATLTTGLAVISITSESIIGIPLILLSLLFWATVWRLFANNDIRTPII